MITNVRQALVTLSVAVLATAMLARAMGAGEGVKIEKLLRAAWRLVASAAPLLLVSR